MRTPFNRVTGSLHRLQATLDRKPETAERIARNLALDAQARDTLLDAFTLAQRYGALNAPELNTLRLILDTWPDATIAERLAVIMTAAELSGQPMTHVRHSILGLQARSNRLAKIGACN